MSGWQLSGDAPSLYNQFAIRAMEQWTDDLIRQANCKDGERVLDVACGTGFVTLRIKEVSGADCELTGLDMNEGMLNAARKNPGVNWQLGSATAMPLAAWRHPHFDPIARAKEMAGLRGIRQSVPLAHSY